ncbi:MAG: hypothetical protein MZV63_66955 [Marinilabiliales bacterium]|nr:hypothetical protein [Marinilabiliales bacterium]
MISSTCGSSLITGNRFHHDNRVRHIAVKLEERQYRFQEVGNAQTVCPDNPFPRLSPGKCASASTSSSPWPILGHRLKQLQAISAEIFP